MRDEMTSSCVSHFCAFTEVLMFFIRLYNGLGCLEGPVGEWIDLFCRLSSNFYEKGNLSVPLTPIGFSLGGKQVLLSFPFPFLTNVWCFFLLLLCFHYLSNWGLVNWRGLEALIAQILKPIAWIIILETLL